VIVCSCNVLSDQQVRSAISRRARAQCAPRVSQVYGGLGCSAQCGRCVGTIRQIMNEMVQASAGGCIQVASV
jgi:bacterioferritin-associated ferredoxin